MNTAKVFSIFCFLILTGIVNAGNADPELKKISLERKVIRAGEPICFTLEYSQGKNSILAAYMMRAYQQKIPQEAAKVFSFQTNQDPRWNMAILVPWTYFSMKQKAGADHAAKCSGVFRTSAKWPSGDYSVELGALFTSPAYEKTARRGDLKGERYRYMKFYFTIAE